MRNQIMVIAPYWLDTAQTWVFDDPNTGLVQEPFVSGIPDMIDSLVAEIPDARRGFRLLFSQSPFPGFQKKLQWCEEEMGGHWYIEADTGMKGWLCPALYRYFAEVPQQLYVKAEPLRSSSQPFHRTRT